MTFVTNAWYGAIWSQDLGDQPVARRILDRPLVLFRTQTGKIAVLEDACPHRFAPLHLGQVVDDAIRCPYHGLEFNSDGKCVRNPHNAGRIPPAAKVKSYIAEERYGMVWVWLGHQKADTDLIPDYSIFERMDTSARSKQDWLIIKANYVLVIENLLDLSHVAVLHEGVLGNAETMNADISVSEDEEGLCVDRIMPDVPPPELVQVLFPDNAGRVDHWATIRLMGVSSLLNDTGATRVGAPREEGAGMHGAHILAPIDEVTTLYHFCAVRWAAGGVDGSDPQVREKLSSLRRIAFAEQDGPIMEAQQRALLDSAIDTSRPALFDIDAGPARFQRRMQTLLKREIAAASTSTRDDSGEASVRSSPRTSAS